MPAVKSSRANLPVTTDRDPHEVHRMKVLDLLQWPAMLVTVAAAWFVASGKRPRRKLGFWLFLLSNLLWIAWGIYAQAFALVTLQLCLAVMNIRGERKNSTTQAP
jgi:hypothetical protein